MISIPVLFGFMFGSIASTIWLVCWHSYICGKKEKLMEERITRAVIEALSKKEMDK